MKAIEESRFSIVVFSENYACSGWCFEWACEDHGVQERNGTNGCANFLSRRSIWRPKADGKFRRSIFQVWNVVNSIITPKQKFDVKSYKENMPIILEDVGKPESIGNLE